MWKSIERHILSAVGILVKSYLVSELELVEIVIRASKAGQ